MPYASRAQQRKFHADPELRRFASEFDAATDFSKLPERAKSGAKRKVRRTVQGRFAHGS